MPAPGYTEVDYKGLNFDLEGKDIWLVQVPPDFNAASAKVKSEDEIEDAHGNSYSLHATDMPLGACQILQPSSKGDLRAVDAKPEGILALMRTVGLPRIDYDKVIKPKPRVPQRSGLRMRHFPTGYGPEAYGMQQNSDQSSADKSHSSTKLSKKLDRGSKDKTSKSKDAGKITKEKSSKSKSSKDKKDTKKAKKETKSRD